MRYLRQSLSLSRPLYIASSPWNASFPESHNQHAVSLGKNHPRIPTSPRLRGPTRPRTGPTHPHLLVHILQIPMATHPHRALRRRYDGSRLVPPFRRVFQASQGEAEGWGVSGSAQTPGERPGFRECCKGNRKGKADMWCRMFPRTIHHSLRTDSHEPFKSP